MDIEARSKLSVNVIHLLKLADRDCDKDGWIPASKPFWQIIHQIPEKLLERERYENGGGRVRITEAGKNVIEFTHGSFVNYSKPSEVRP